MNLNLKADWLFVIYHGGVCCRGDGEVNSRNAALTFQSNLPGRLKLSAPSERKKFK